MTAHRRNPEMTWSVRGLALTTLIGLFPAACAEGVPGSASGPANAEPSVSIASPPDGMVAEPGAPVRFEGSAVDPEDGMLGGESLRWSSSLEGDLGVGVSFTRDDLTAGVHAVTLTATDSDGAEAATAVTLRIPEVEGQPPVATISSPPDGASFARGEAVSFAGSGVDPEDGTLPGSSLAWTSSLDGSLGTGTSFSHSGLSVGTHEIELTAVDSDGRTGSTSRTIAIASASNASPSATITSPSGGEIFTSGTAISLEGSGDDPEDGALSGASLVWSSDLDGQLGTGSSLSTAGLGIGRHTITLTAVDAQGATGTSSIVLSVATVGVPLNDMRSGDTYKGFVGGLYPGRNSPPSTHRAEGVSRADAIAGTAVLMSLGMSNAEQHFSDFLARVQADGSLSPDLVVVNGAHGGAVASDWESPSDAAYSTAASRLGAAGVTEDDVDALWILQANPHPSVSLPSANADAWELVERLGNVLRATRARYPNLSLAFFSSRIYSCARSGLNPEPYAYESGFAIKWLIEAQIHQVATGQVDPIAGDLDYRDGTAPWIAWSSYLWADNGNPRRDGLTWSPADLEADCTHPSASGEAKVGSRLLSFFKGSPFSSPWFLP